MHISSAASMLSSESSATLVRKRSAGGPESLCSGSLTCWFLKVPADANSGCAEAAWDAEPAPAAPQQPTDAAQTYHTPRPPRQKPVQSSGAAIGKSTQGGKADAGRWCHSSAKSDPNGENLPAGWGVA